MFQLLIVIIYISFISLGLPDSLLGSAWPSMYQGLGVSVSYAGIISLIISGGTIVSSLYCNRLVHKFGTGALTAISVGMTATALFGFSISNSFVALCIWAVPYGLGAGSVDAALNNYVALHYKAKHMNWLHCFWGIGATIGPYIMGACLTHNYEWTQGYRIIAVIQIVLTVVLVMSIPLWKQEGQGESDTKEETTTVTFRQLIKRSGAKQILVAFFCYCSLEQVTGLWGSSYMVIEKHISSKSAATFLSLFYLGITIGRLLSGFLTMKFSNRNMIRLGQGIALIGVLILPFAWNPVVTCVGFIMIGLGCAPIYPGLLHQTPERFGKEISQSIMGLQMACAYIGSTCSPFIVGFIVEKVDVRLYPVVLLGFVLLLIYMVEYCNRLKKDAF